MQRSKSGFLNFRPRRIINFAGIFLPVLLLCALAIGSVLNVDYSRRRAAIENDQFQIASLVVVSFQRFYAAVSGEVLGLANDRDIARFLDGDETALADIELLFRDLAQRRVIYDQIRLLDENGQERLRINSRGGNLETVAPESLQDQSSRYYFAEAMAVGSGQIYVSDFDLNVENGAIEDPIRPLVRIATPLETESGERWGILIANVDGSAFINAMRTVSAESNTDLWLINQAGYWLVGPSPEDEWAFMYPDRSDRSLAQTDPDLWQLISNEPVVGFDHEGDWYSRIPFCGDLSCRFTYQIRPDPTSTIDLDLPDASQFLVSRIPAERLSYAAVLLPNLGQWAPLSALMLALVVMVGIVSWRLINSFDLIGRRDSQLNQQRALLDGFVERNPNVMFVNDVEGNYLVANEAMRKLAGSPSGSLVGANREEFFPAEVVSNFEKHEQLVLENGSSVELLAGLPGKYDTRYFRTFRFPMFDSQGAIAAFGGIAVNVTDTVVAQQELNRQRDTLEQNVRERTEELEQARRKSEDANKAKSAFLATMSHEIRTPMNGVLGMVEVLRMSSLNSQQMEQANLIRESARSLLTIIDDILDFSKIEAGKIALEEVPMVLSYQIESACAALEGVAKQRQVELSFYRSPQLPETIMSDSVRLRQIINNIAGNALKFASGLNRKGKVCVRFEAVDEATLKISVKDNGIGMSESQMARIFGAFEQANVSTTRRFGGTGLGLAITKRLVELFDGQISVESELDSGTTITVTLPLRVIAKASSPEFTYHGNLQRVHVYTPNEQKLADWRSYFAATGLETVAITDLKQSNLNTPPGDSQTGESVLLVDEDADLAALVEQLSSKIDPDLHQVIVLTNNGSSVEACTVDGFNTVDKHISHAKNFRNVLYVLTGVDIESHQEEESAFAYPAIGRDEAVNLGRYVLVVEDNEINQQVIRNQMSLLGIACDIAANGQEALTLWEKNRSRYRLILTDLHMPIMDGYELITNIRQRETSGNHTPVLALTADATKGERERCLSLGMNDYLAKPVPLEALSQTIEIWLNNDSDPLSNEREVDRPGGSAIDRDVVKNYLGDDQNLIDEFVGNYLYLAPRAGAGIQSDYRQHDWNALLEKAHAFKSSSKTIGALDLAELCGSLISACVSRNEGRIGEAFEFFNRELEDVIRELSHWRESSARKRRESNGQ